jgi:hypothetical protein
MLGFVLDPRNKIKALVFVLVEKMQWACVCGGRGRESSNIVEDTRREDVNHICSYGSKEDKETQ